MDESLSQCIAASWSPEIGDPNATGWLTVLAYLLCFGLSVAVWRRLRGQRGRALWTLIMMMMLFLAVNKQLDLQSAMTAWGRCLAKAQGWYQDRRTVQEGFILGLLAVAGLVLIAGLVGLRGHLRRHGLALTGLTILLAFIMVRAVGFHHFDRLIGMRQFGVSANYLFENSGLLLIALNAMIILRGRRGRPARIS